MEWTHDSMLQIYSVTEGKCHGRTWRHANGTWIAIVIDYLTTTAQEGFLTAEAAMAWCEQQITKE